MKINLSAPNLTVSTTERKPRTLTKGDHAGETRGVAYSHTFVKPADGITEEQAKETLAALGSARSILRLVCKAVTKSYRAEAFALATGQPSAEQKAKARKAKKIDKMFEALLEAGFTVEEIAAKFAAR